MNIRNTLVLFLQRVLAPLGFRVVKLTTDKVRGFDPMRDLVFLLQGKRDATIFDVGANDGETLQDFLHAFPDAQVTAFEPHTECCDILSRKFQGQSRVRVHNVALGAHRGTSSLNLFSGNRMNSLLRFDDAPDNMMSGSFLRTGAVDVRVETLDDYCDSQGIAAIDILKTDTQGYDLQVLKGATRLIESRRIKTILLEVNFVPMYQGQATFPQLHEFLTSRGYRLVDFYNQLRNDGYTAWCDACYVATNLPATLQTGAPAGVATAAAC